MISTYLVSPVESYLLRVRNNPGVHVAQVAFPVRLLGHQLAKFGRAGTQDLRRGKDHEPGQQGRPGGVGPSGPGGLNQRVGGQHHIQYRLGEVRIEVGHRLGKHHDVLGERLVRVGEPPVHVADFVIGLIGEVGPVGMVHQPGAEGQGQFALQVPDGAVDERGRDGNEEPFDQLDNEALGFLLHDRFDNLTVQAGHVYREKRPGYQRHRVQGEQTELFGHEPGEEDFSKFEDLLKKFCIYPWRRFPMNSHIYLCLCQTSGAVLRLRNPAIIPGIFVFAELLADDGVQGFDTVSSRRKKHGSLRRSRPVPFHSRRRIEDVGHFFKR